MKPPGKDGRRTLGARGEQMAAEHLRRHGIEILATNWRPTGSEAARDLRGELDIIARDAEALVFVEVRTRRGASGLAEESVTAAKAAQVAQLAAAYLQAHGIDQDAVDWRIDVVAITLSSAGPRINWIRHAVVG